MKIKNSNRAWLLFIRLCAVIRTKIAFNFLKRKEGLDEIVSQISSGWETNSYSKPLLTIKWTDFPVLNIQNQCSAMPGQIAVSTTEIEKAIRKKFTQTNFSSLPNYLGYWEMLIYTRYILLNIYKVAIEKKISLGILAFNFNAKEIKRLKKMAQASNVSIVDQQLHGLKVKNYLVGVSIFRGDHFFCNKCDMPLLIQYGPVRQKGDRVIESVECSTSKCNLRKNLWDS